MEFRVLGPLEVISDGRPVPIGGSRERTLLARLVLSANQVVSSDALTEDLWRGAATEGANQALWVTMSRLRKALRGNGDDLIITRPPGYLLQVGEEAIDSCRFEGLVERGRQLAAAGDFAAAAAALQEALALWRGPALADIAETPFARAEAARLNEARLAALEERIDADLACGRHGPLMGELAGLTREHPLRERLWGQRMLALYRAGRQAEALRSYQDVRRYLGEELGIEPGEELRRLETAMLRHDPDLAWTPSEPAGEPAESPPTGVVSFLFTDLVGSTELLHKLGDDAANDLRRRHFGVLRDALDTHGGAEVKSLGDGLMAAFTSPLAAVRCAVTIQRSVAAKNGSDPSPIEVRVGLHAGEPIGEEDDYFGTPVVVAQRLCARARGGQILASSLVHGLVGNRSGCPFTPLGGLALKGLAEPVAACEIVWTEKPSEAALPLPLPLERESSLFVARTDELLRLEAAWDEARAGRRQLVLVAGEPGIGKTRLAAEFARRLHADGGVTVLFGRCDDGMGIPYQPFVEALGAYVRQAAEPVLGRLGGELVRLVPEIAHQVVDLPDPIRSDPETERYRLFDAVAAWLSATSAECPVVLVIDDLQWAGRPSLFMLGHLLRSGEPLRLLVVATYRDTDLDVTAELSDSVADLLRHPGVNRIRLAGLDESGVAAYFEAQARHELTAEDRAMAAAVFAGTAGNPFFIGQVLRHLVETEAIVRREGRWMPEVSAAALGVPEGVRDVISRRLSRLPAETGDLLSLASVIGDRFGLDVLVRAASEPEVSTLRALDPAITARLVTETGDANVEYRFVHALVRATLYDSLPPGRRTEYHFRTAEAIEAAHDAPLDDDVPALAHHYARAGRAGRGAAIEYATRAGDQALAQRAHHDAAGWYAQALDLLTSTGSADSEQRCDLLISLGEAQRRAGNPAHRSTLLEAARLAQELEDSLRLARAALANTRGFFAVAEQVDVERTTVMEEALEALGDGDSGFRARLLVTLASEMEYSPDWDRRRRLISEGLMMARRLGDPEVLGNVLAFAYIPAFGFLNVPELDQIVSELVAVSEQLGDPTLRCWGASWRAVSAALVGDVSVARQHADVATGLADEIRVPFMRWMTAYLQANLRTTTGPLDTAEAMAQQALERAQEAGLPDGFRSYGAVLFWIRYHQGRLDELVDLLRRALGRGEERPITRAALCVALCEIDRPEEARNDFRRLAVDGFAAFRGYTWLYAASMVCDVCTRVGDGEAAEVLLGLLAPHHALVAIQGGVVTGPVVHHLGILTAFLGRHDEADAHYREAARIEERMGAPAWLARTRLEWARSLLARAGPGDAERAKTLLNEALQTAREMGLGTVERRATELLTSP